MVSFLQAVASDTGKGDAEEQLVCTEVEQSAGDLVCSEDEHSADQPVFTQADPSAEELVRTQAEKKAGDLVCTEDEHSAEQLVCSEDELVCTEDEQSVRGTADSKLPTCENTVSTIILIALATLIKCKHCWFHFFRLSRLILEREMRRSSWCVLRTSKVRVTRLGRLIQSFQPVRTQ